jgi:hypothetical protein
MSSSSKESLRHIYCRISDRQQCPPLPRSPSGTFTVGSQTGIHILLFTRSLSDTCTVGPQTRSNILLFTRSLSDTCTVGPQTGSHIHLFTPSTVGQDLRQAAISSSSLTSSVGQDLRQAAISSSSKESLRHMYSGTSDRQQYPPLNSQVL